MDFNPKTYLLQVGLQTLGFPPGDCDGKHGTDTEDAFQRFLASRGEALSSTPGARSIGQRGLDLVKHFEGLFLTAYKCPADVWTIGYGHTGLTHKDGTVYPGRKVTTKEAEALLQHDLTEFAKGVSEVVKVELNQDQFDAVVSFAFNVGLGNLKSSTLLRKLNAGDYAGAAGQFPQWNKAAGRVLSGLTRRRASERNLFNGVQNFIVPA